MGVNDHRQCLEGWHARETDGRNGLCYRWSKEEASFKLFLPEKTLAIHLMVAGPLALTGEPLGVSLYVKDELLTHIPEAVRTEFWNVLEVALPPSWRERLQGETIFTLRTEKRTLPPGLGGKTFQPLAFIPDLHLHNGDHRHMGVMLAAARAAHL